jgi:hypothetical protein
MSTSGTEPSVNQLSHLPQQPQSPVVTTDFSKPPLVITENDLEPDIRGMVHAVRNKDRVLGGTHTNEVEAVFDAIPGTIARRLRRITPAEFRLAEITLELALDVDIPGFKIGGTVTVTLQPKEVAGAD